MVRFSSANLAIPITIFLPYGFISIIVSLLILIKQIMLRIIFTGPMKRVRLSDPGWDIIATSNDGSDVYGFINFQEAKSDLVVFVHGWQSSSEKYAERMNLFKFEDSIPWQSTCEAMEWLRILSNGLLVK